MKCVLQGECVHSSPPHTDTAQPPVGFISQPAWSCNDRSQYECSLWGPIHTYFFIHLYFCSFPGCSLFANNIIDFRWNKANYCLDKAVLQPCAIHARAGVLCLWWKWSYLRLGYLEEALRISQLTADTAAEKTIGLVLMLSYSNNWAYIYFLFFSVLHERFASSWNTHQYLELWMHFNWLGSHPPACYLILI